LNEFAVNGHVSFKPVATMKSVFGSGGLRRCSGSYHAPAKSTLMTLSCPEQLQHAGHAIEHTAKFADINAS
jgi:hypothetical protein